MLGIKLMLSVPRHFLPSGNPIHDFLASSYFISVLTLLIFIVPVVVHRLRTPSENS